MDSGLIEAAQAQLQRWYPQFGSVVPPQGTAAVRAWRGRIQPFPDGTDFLSVMSHLQAGHDVRVERYGRLTHPSWCKKRHQFDIPFSLAVAQSFEVVLLGFERPRHPRVYAVQPEISRRAFPFHPHLRDDQGAIIDCKPLTALCTYLSSDGVLPRDDMELVHALDFTSMFLAKHMVWVATSALTIFSIEKGQEVVGHDPLIARLFHRGRVFDGTDAMFAHHYRTDAAIKTLQEQVEEWLNRGYWHGLWPATWVGPAAPHFINELYEQFPPDAECHCGSGLSYDNCHRREDGLALAMAR